MLAGYAYAEENYWTFKIIFNLLSANDFIESNVIEIFPLLHPCPSIPIKILSIVSFIS